jgi:hypothetical protein
VAAGGASVDMSAERSGTATLDCGEHFQMQAVEPVPVVIDEPATRQTNHISHLDRWPDHLLVFGPFEAERVERTGRCVQLPGRDMEINGGLLQIAVAQQQLNRTQVGASFQQMGGKAVPPMRHCACGAALGALEMLIVAAYSERPVGTLKGC